MQFQLVKKKMWIRINNINLGLDDEFDDKGTVECGKDADFVIVDENTLDIDTVIAKGKKMMENGDVIVTGFFDKLNSQANERK